MKNRIELITVKSPAAVETESGFPIIELGASAGGRGVPEVFLQQVPGINDLGGVNFQHLNAQQAGIIAKWFQRMASMKVIQVTYSTPIKSDCVYVIPRIIADLPCAACPTARWTTGMTAWSTPLRTSRRRNKCKFRCGTPVRTGNLEK